LSGGSRARRDRPEGASFVLIWERVAERIAQQPQERAQQREAAAPLFDELMALPEFLRRAAVQTQPRFWNPGLADLLLRTGETPAMSEHARPADLALEILGQLKEQQPGLTELFDLEVMARCARADADRRAGHFSAAESELRILARGLAGEPAAGPERAVYCRYLALLRADQGWHDEALALLQRASSLFQEWGEPVAAGESLAERAWLARDGGDLVGALDDFERALPLLYDAGWTRAAIRTCHGLALIASELGDAERAEATIAGARALYEEVPAAERLRFLVVEARVAENLGQVGRAIAGLEPLVGGFLIDEAYHDAAIAAVELARLYADAGRRADLERLRQEVAPLIEPNALPEQARAVVLFAFLFAGRRGTDVSELLAEAAGYLERSRENPGLPFRSAEGEFSELYWDLADSGVRRRLCRDADLPSSIVRLRAGEIAPAHRLLIAWTQEELARVRVRFESPPAPEETRLPVAWKILRWGRGWSADEVRARWPLLPEKFEVLRGRLLWTDEEKTAVLGMLLESVGLDAAIRLAPRASWLAALRLPRGVGFSVHELALPLEVGVRDEEPFVNLLGFYWAGRAPGWGNGEAWEWRFLHIERSPGETVDAYLSIDPRVWALPLSFGWDGGSVFLRLLCFEIAVWYEGSEPEDRESRS